MMAIRWTLYKQYVIASYLIMSGDRIPLGALGPTQPPKQRVPSLFPEGKAAEAWRWPPTHIYRLG